MPYDNMDLGQHGFSLQPVGAMSLPEPVVTYDGMGFFGIIFFLHENCCDILN